MKNQRDQNGKADGDGGNGAASAEKVDADGPNKVEKLTKAGRDLDPNDGSE